MLDIVVATTVSPGNVPRAFMSRAASRSTASPFTTRPLASQKSARSASPSKVTPRSNCPGLLRHCPGHGFRMQRAAAFIDVLAVRSCTQNRRLNAAQAEQFRRFGGGGAMGAIHQHSQAA